jgi:hypothetical protein
MASVGLTQEEMAAVLEISVETLVKHYPVELATAAAAANEAVGRSLWLQAVGGPTKNWTRQFRPRQFGGQKLECAGKSRLPSNG